MVIPFISLLRCAVTDTEKPVGQCTPNTYQDSPAPVVDLPILMPTDFRFVYDHTVHAYDSKRNVFTHRPWCGTPVEHEILLSQSELQGVYDNFRENSLATIRTQFTASSDKCGLGIGVSHPTPYFVEFYAMNKSKKILTNGQYLYRSDADFVRFGQSIVYLMSVIGEKTKSLNLTQNSCNPI